MNKIQAIAIYRRDKILWEILSFYPGEFLIEVISNENFPPLFISSNAADKTIIAYYTSINGELKLFLDNVPLSSSRVFDINQPNDFITNFNENMDACYNGILSDVEISNLYVYLSNRYPTNML